MKTLHTFPIKTGIFFALLFVLAGLGAQTSGDVAHNPGFKLGFVAGYPSGLSLAYRFNKDFEMNGLIGTNFSDLAIGLDGMFRITDIVIAKEVFPLSIGPGVYAGTSWYWGGFYLGAFFKVHAEYTFKNAPFNLFLETGPGLSTRSYSNAFMPSFDWTGAFGARFVFDHPSL